MRSLVICSLSWVVLLAGCGGKTDGVSDNDAPVVAPSVPGGVYGVVQVLSLTCDDGANGSGCKSLYLTIDGSDPTTGSTVYEEPLVLSETTTVKVIAEDFRGNVSDIVEETYVIDLEPPEVVAAPEGGAFAGAQQVTLTCTDADSSCTAIYYTLDGSAPTTSSDVYQSPLDMSETTTLRFFAEDEGGHASPGQEHDYLIDPDAPATVAVPGGSGYKESHTVVLLCDDGDGTGCAATYYTTDGNDPTTASTEYAGPFDVTASLTLKFFSMDFVDNAEPVVTESYLIDGVPPVTTPNPAGGAFASTQSVTLTCADNEAGCDQIYYTTDGSTPTTASDTYMAPLDISADTTLKFFATDAVGNAEGVQTHTYVIDTVAPTTAAVPPGGSYRDGRLVALVCSDGGGTGCATTYYTTDGSDPDTGSNVYTGPISITSSTTLEFFSQDAVSNAGSIVTEVYIIDNAPPATTAAPSGGTYNTPQAVTLTCDDGAGSGCATTYYTTDGSDPDTGSNVYAGPIAIGTDTTLKFFSVDVLGNEADIDTEVYVVDTDDPITTASPAGGIYNSSQTVTLTCDDGSGTGCDQIYYTTDGNDPDTGSTVYSSPIDISATTTLKFLATDLAGNQETIQTEIYTLDLTAPVTTAVPAGGLFASAQSVTLTCDDGAGTGCDQTYYTTDGSDPDAGSSVYSAPVSINTTTTLKFFSADVANNEETFQTEVYTIDTDPPDVSATSPYDNETNVRVDSVITVTFDEDMDPLSIGAASITLDDGGSGVSGTVSYDAPTRTATFTPDADLADASTFTATVSGTVTDLAGNAMGSDYVFAFTTPTPTLQISGAGSATQLTPAMAFNSTGDGLAVWTSFTGDEVRYLYSLYDNGTDTWSAEQVLDTRAASSVNAAALYQAAVASDGTDFMVAWWQSGINVAEYSSGAFGSVTTFATPSGWSNNSALEIASDGATYAAAWLRNDGTTMSVYGAFYDGANWGPEELLELDSFNAAGSLSLAASSAGYLVGFRQNSGAWVAEHDGSTGWAAERRLDGGGASVGAVAVASRGSDYCIVWGAGTNTLASIGSEPTFSSETIIGTTVSGPPNLHDVASDGSGYAATWTEYDGADYSVFANVYASGSWGTKTVIESSTDYAVGTSIAAAGTSYVVLMKFGTGVSDLWTATYSGSWAAEVMVESGTGDAEDEIIVSRLAEVMLSWVQDSGTEHQVYGRRYDGASFQPVTEILTGDPGSVKTSLHVAVNSTGNLMAVWQQLHRGDNAVFAARRNAGTWEAPVLLATRAEAPDVASNGTGFAATYEAYPTSSTHQIVARTYSAGTWNAETSIEGQPTSCDTPAIASDGAGYAAVFDCGDDLYGAIYSSGSWGSETLLESASGAIFNPRVASNGTSYMAVWRQVLGGLYSTVAAEATFSGSWSWGTAELLESEPYSVFGGPEIATDGVGYATVWNQGHIMRANVHDGSSWLGQSELANVGLCSPAMDIASDGTGYLAVYVCGSRIRANEYSAGSWGSIVTSNEFSASSMAVDSDGSSYVTLYSSGTNVERMFFIAGAWDTSAPVDNFSTSASTVDTAYDGTFHTAVWIQGDEADTGVSRAWSREAY